MTAALLPPPPDWMADALCAQVDPELWFPDKGGSTREAKRVCTGCEVKAECLRFAVDNDERFGIWGGLSERERRRLRERPPQVAVVSSAPVVEAPRPQRRHLPPQRRPTGRLRRTWTDDELRQAVAVLPGMAPGDLAAVLDAPVAAVRRALRAAA